MELGKLEIYKLAIKLSDNIWNIYNILSMDLNMLGKKINGFIKSIKDKNKNAK